VDVLDVERETELFEIPGLPDFVTTERPDTVFPVILADRDRDVERTAWVEE
jgi:hypothetical protein